MQKFLRTLMLMALMIVPFASHAQVIVEIGESTSTTTQYTVPVNMYYNYSLTQQIFTADEIGVAGTINSIAFEYTNTSSFSMDSVRVYMKNVTKTEFATTTDMEAITSTDLVWEGTLSAADAGWVTLTLTTPFVYDGTSNLLVCCYDNQSGYPGSAFKFRTTTTGSAYRGIAYYSDSYTPSIDDVTTFSGTKTRYTYRNNIRLGITPSGNYCMKPTNLTVSNIAASGATLTWHGEGVSYTLYEYANLDSAAYVYADTIANLVTLEPNTEYTFGVTSTCSNGVESSMTTVTFRTACDAIATLPYTMGFEASEILATTPNADALPFCWSRYASGTGSYTYYPYSYSSSTYAHGGSSRVLYFYDGTGASYPDTMVAILPELDVVTYPMNANRLTFWGRVSSGTNVKNVQIGTMTDPTDMSTFALVETVAVSGTTHTLYSVPLTNASATAPYLAIMLVKSASGYLCIDDLTLEEMPSCLEISNLAAGNITSSSVELTWSDAANASATYTVYNMADTSVVATGVTGTTYTVTGLNANTQYNFGVAANCPAGDASIMTVSARTACAEETMPWSENFDTWTTKSPCWSFLSGAYNMGAGTPTTTTSGWAVQTTYGNYITISGKALGFNLYSTNRYWAVTPGINITSNDVMLSVDVAVAAWSAATPNYDADDTLAFAISTDGGSTFTNLMVLDNTQLNALGGTYTTINVPVAGYNGQTVRFAIFGGSSASGGDNRIVIDNVSVMETPSCMPVTGLTLDSLNATSANVHWVSTGATGYEVEVRQNDVPVTTVSVVVADTTAVISGLAIDNDYEVVVRAICGNDYSPWSSALNLHVGYCSPNPTSRDAQGITGVAFGGMTNTTTHPSAAPFYGNYYTMAGTVPAGLTASVDITFATGYTYGTIIWVDWNNSLTFDADEVVYRGTSESTNPTTLTATFDIPATQAVGNYRMRIAAADSYFDSYVSDPTSTPNPCFSSTYAVAEDYTLTVSAVPSCMPVSNLAADNITTDGATLTWTGDAASYNVYVIAADTTLVQNVATTTLTLTGLTAMTQYTYGVTAVCTSSESDMVSVTFATACSSISLPFTETFEATSATTGCWTTDGPGTWTIATGDYTVATGAYEGSLNASITHGVSGDTTKLISPVLSGVTNGMQLQFAHIQRSWYGDIDNLAVYYRTSSDATWQQLVNYTDEVAVWTVDTINIPGTVYQVAFEYADNYGYGVGVDSVAFNLPPACMPVGNLTVSNITTDGATLSWTGSAASYDVYNGTTLVTNTTNNTYTFTGLTPATTYTFGVQAICSATDTAALATITVTTACADITTLPYMEGFETGLGCWSTVNGSADGYPWFTVSSTSGVTPHSGNNTAISVSYYSDAVHANAWLISPKFILPTIGTGDTLNLSWWHAVSSYYPTELYDVMLSTTTDDTAAFTTTLLAVNPDSTSDWVNKVVDMSAYAGQSVYIAFHHHDSYDQNYLLIDDIALTIGAAPAPLPDTLTVTFAVNDATMGTTVPAPGTYQYISGDTLSFSAMPNTGYIFNGWVIAYGDGSVDSLSVDYISASAPADVFMNYSPMTITALFGTVDPNSDSMQVNVAVNDPTMGTTIPAPGTHYFHVGEVASVVAVPNNGYHLTGWTVNVVSEGVTYVDTTYNYAIDDVFDLFGGWVVSESNAVFAWTVTANFAAGEPPVMHDSVTVNVSVNNETMGVVTPAPGTHYYVLGDTVIMSIMPNPGYRVVSVQMSATHPILGTLFDETITDSLELAELVGVNDTLIVDDEEMYGMVVNINVIFAAEGTEPTTYSVEVAYDQTKGTVTGAGDYVEGSNVRLVAMPATHYEFYAWLDNNTGDTVGRESVYAIANIDRDYFLTAIFVASTGIDDVDMDNVTIYSTDNVIVVRGAEGKQVTLFDVNGRMLSREARAAENVEFRVNNSGVYLVKVANAAAKRVVVIR